MIHLDWVERRVQAGVREWSVEDLRRRCAARRHGECFDAKAPDETFMAPALFVRLDVALIPSDTKGGLGYLDDKEVEIRLRRKSLDDHVHDLHWARGSDPHCCFRVGQARFRSSRSEERRVGKECRSR